MTATPMTAPHTMPTLTPDFDDWLEIPMPTREYFVPKGSQNRLALGSTGYGPHHFLDGRPVYDGSELEVQVGGVWRRGLYSWSYRLIDAPRLVRFGVEGLSFEVMPDAVCRWVSP